MIEQKGFWAGVAAFIAGLTLQDVNTFFSTASFAIGCVVGLVTLYQKLKSRCKNDQTGTDP